MEYIDLGLPSGTLWASENEINTDGTPYFTYDEAKEKFGDSMPTREDIIELIIHSWKKWDNFYKGMEFMGNNGTRMFFPANGFRERDKTIFSKNHSGKYWSNTRNYDSCNADYAYALNFECDRMYCESYDRNIARSVRLVKRGGEK